ncbi:unnamed protein product [Rhizoctonia solani]|uniref:Fungal-type protein kinase domain-containing protein n=1 Tax=Rhizoctonia solani TaxID=456999 RepID=A0A8H3A989_9AGAM|nr:unnamed protein product [Rhizoctonia solani]
MVAAPTSQTSDAGPAVNEEVQTRRLIDTLCHRKSISGRATIVLRIGKVEQGGDGSEGDEYVLKIMWRDPERGLEEEALKRRSTGSGNADNISIGVSPEEGDKDPESTTVDTSACRPTSRRRPRRICTFIVMSSKGVPPERAESPRQFMQAVLDAILGYWGRFNLGILHHDVSEGNVLLLSPRQQMDRQSRCTKVADEVLIELEKKLH